MTAFRRIAIWLQERDQWAKMAIIATADLIILTFVVLAAYVLRLSSFELPPMARIHLYLMAPLISVVSALAFGVYRSAARNYSLSLEKRLATSQLVVPLIWSFGLLFFGLEGFARSTILIYGMLSIIAMVVLRRAAAWLFATSDRASVPRREQIPLLVYGASREGQMLADGLMRQGRYRPVAFIDTDYTVVDRLVCGLKVYSSETLDQVLDKHRARVVVIAKPDQNRAQRRAAVDMFLDRGLEVKTMPGLEEIADGKVDVTALRPIHLADLLGRDPVPPDRALMEHAVRDKVVMVTGAGGSIGSELVRQIKPLAPRKIVMVDESEFFLFEINRDMEGRKSASGSTTTLVAVLADIRDRQRMEEIMAEHQVDMVLHAAAYKHVRMVQENATAGIRNNVWGTLALAEAAIAQGVERFVMISTDKAVRPTSVMGASKRVAEMVIQALAARTNSKTVFTMVRFGNVLGSTGSVVPLFTEQIAKGGPVLVTHPEVTRYFMLIPEAAQLVIQAGAMAKGGEVFVLNMGESIKIVQLAETMIELAGLTRRSADNPDGDIEIKFIGLRDGEKLYEELQIGRDVALTSHPRIMKSHEYWMKWEELSRQLKELDRRLRGNDREAGIALLFELASRDR